MLGEVTVDANRKLPDANSRERLILAVLSLFILFMGVASPLFTSRMQTSADNVLRLMTRSHAVDALGQSPKSNSPGAITANSAAATTSHSLAGAK
jgi:NADH:ubiquinone oxidoreductase subunit 4 (subunit M)